MSDSVPRPPRPVLRADLVALVGGSQDADPAIRGELAAATAAVVVAVGREGGDPSRLLNLADEVGLDTLAELWRDAGPDTLPGALWAVYLLRTWCRAHAEEVARLWRAGRAYAPADEVVAGVADDADPDAMAALADASCPAPTAVTSPSPWSGRRRSSGSSRPGDGSWPRMGPTARPGGNWPSATTGWPTV